MARRRWKIEFDDDTVDGGVSIVINDEVGTIAKRRDDQIYLTEYGDNWRTVVKEDTLANYAAAGKISADDEQLINEWVKGSEARKAKEAHNQRWPRLRHDDPA